MAPAEMEKEKKVVEWWRALSMTYSFPQGNSFWRPIPSLFFLTTTPPSFLPRAPFLLTPFILCESLTVFPFITRNAIQGNSQFLGCPFCVGKVGNPPTLKSAGLERGRKEKEKKGPVQNAWRQSSRVQDKRGWPFHAVILAAERVLCSLILPSAVISFS